MAPIVPTHSSRTANPSAPSRGASTLGRLGFVLCLATAPGLGCVGQSSDIDNTDTGNPPAIDERALHVEASEPGKVVVFADAGAVSPAGASVTVTNAVSNDEASTTAGKDGSFEVTLDGSPSDDFELVIEADGETKAIMLSSAGPAPSGLEGLNGHSYLLDSATGLELVVGATLRIWFQDGMFNFRAGCNQHSGMFDFCGQSLCLTGLGSTLIGCEQAQHDQDERLSTFFSSMPTLALQGTQLTIASADTTLVFVDTEVALPDRALTGTTWNIDTFIEGTAASHRPSSAVPTLTLDEDGTLRVFTGCNDGNGTFEYDSASLTLSAIAYTRRGCADELDRDSEQDVMAVLQEGELSVEIDESRLTLMRGEIGLSAFAE